MNFYYRRWLAPLVCFLIEHEPVVKGYISYVSEHAKYPTVHYCTRCYQDVLPHEPRTLWQRRWRTA